jgi:porphobilinogen deaminase
MALLFAIPIAHVVTAEGPDHGTTRSPDHAVERLPNALDDTARQDLLKRTLGTQKVGERLNRGCSLPLGISSRGEEAKGERHTYLVVAYDYSALGRGQADGAAGRGYLAYLS